MDSRRIERSETDRHRWELVVARVGAELDKLVDATIDKDVRDQAANTVFDLYCSLMARAQELEAFADYWIAHDPVLHERLDTIRIEFPLPVPSSCEASPPASST
jgi:hypothetical protein